MSSKIVERVRMRRESSLYNNHYQFTTKTVDNEEAIDLPEIPPKVYDSLYVQTPFCSSRCSFCRYFRGFGSKRDIAEYFEEILPSFLERIEVRDYLKSREYLDCYFGGGTASIASARQWRRIFELLPLDRVSVRCFEGSPDTLHEDHLKLLSDFGFHYLSVGVQLFDNQILKKNNRPSVNRELIRDFISLAEEKYGLLVGIDMLLGIDDGDERDLDPFIENLNDSMLNPRPISITVNVKRPMRNRQLTFQKLVPKLSNINGNHGYKCVTSNLDTPNFDAKYNRNTTEYRFMRDRHEFIFRMITGYVMAEFYNTQNINIWDLRKSGLDCIIRQPPTPKSIAVRETFSHYRKFRKSVGLPYLGQEEIESFASIL